MTRGAGPAEVFPHSTTHFENEMTSRLCSILDGLDLLSCKLLTLVAQFATLTAPRLYKPIPVSIYYTQAYAKIITLLIDRNTNPRLSAGGVRGGRLHYFPLEPPISNTVSAAHEAKSIVCRVGSLAPCTFLTETELYTATESPRGEPFAIDQRYFRDIFRVHNPTFGGSR